MSENANLSTSAVQASQEVRATIGRLRRRILNASQDEDLTFGQASTMARLSDKEGVSVSDLASAEGVRHQSMTETVNALVAMGLLARTPDPDDGRRQLVKLTDMGHGRVEQGRQARGEWLATRFQDRCTEEERRTVITAMAVLERLTRD
ncbi:MULTISPECIES: MarR family winged helix-turn-helix transcriptional regulator [unclassified Streptomyces]|uniref:MarR family winged helix-turn-helix transcriptional regulator n=1 Tax=unclassified Streptomyces TaxID=2593676 RepID=UPI002E1EF05C|nr:MarR family transcriptional regulator [Streptomyces sp. NBC_01023]